MTYFLGIDLGTTYTAAAVSRDGRLAMVELGTRTTTVPSVLYHRGDGEFLVGEAAVRRSFDDPDRVAREFKRRFGDDTPLILAGSPFSAETLTGQLLRFAINQTVEREGSAPAGLAVTYPANWGPFRRELLEGVVREAGLTPSILVPEPVAAVAHYASGNRVPDGGLVAVYDLGGGTFDAAVVRKTATGFDLLGKPEGIEHLGGVDIDVAVFSHVLRSIGLALDPAKDPDPAQLGALIRLRADCVDAKEVLSADTEVEIPVQLPSVTTRIRLTRAELEAMIRPPIQRTIDGLLMALASAEVTPDQLHAVLLVGGTSRVPLVGQLVTEALGRPVAVDAHPKHPVAMGAALLLAAGQTASPGTVVVTPPGSPPAAAQPPASTALPGGAPPPPPPSQPLPPPPTQAQPAAVAPDRPAGAPAAPELVRPSAALAVEAVPDPAPPAGGFSFEAAPRVAAKKPAWLIPAAIGAVVLLVAGIGWRVLGGKGDDGSSPSVTDSSVTASGAAGSAGRNRRPPGSIADHRFTCTNNTSKVRPATSKGSAAGECGCAAARANVAV